MRYRMTSFFLPLSTYVHDMKQILFACGLAASTLIASASLAADKLSLNAISHYLTGITSAQADFTQISSDGYVATGTLYIKRPGKMRFEYDAPNTGIVVAGQGAVAVADAKSNTGPEIYPLSRTPLSIILARTVNLAAENMVVGHDFDGTATVVKAQDPKRTEAGSIEMSFTGSPIELRQWVIYDSSGEATTVILGEMNIGLNLNNDLFNSSNPILD